MDKKPVVEAGITPPEIPVEVHFIEEGEDSRFWRLPAFVSHAPRTKEQEKRWQELYAAESRENLK